MDPAHSRAQCLSVLGCGLFCPICSGGVSLYLQLWDTVFFQGSLCVHLFGGGVEACS